MAKVNSKQVVFLMDILGGDAGCDLTLFVNDFGNFGACKGDVSVYIEKGEYHLAIGDNYFNGLDESDLINKLSSQTDRL